jgi:hypothetical protein
MWLGAFRIVEQASRQVSLESVVNGFCCRGAGRRGVRIERV